MPSIISSVSEEDEEQRLAADMEGMRIIKSTIEIAGRRRMSMRQPNWAGRCSGGNHQLRPKSSVDLIAAGSRGLGAVRGWLMGSVSRKLAHYSGCSVLIARCLPTKRRNFFQREVCIFVRLRVRVLE